MLTYFLHGCVQREEALSQQLVHHLLIICMDLGDHVTGNEAEPGTGLPTVEAICVFVSIYLESKGVGVGEIGASDKAGSATNQPHWQQSHLKSKLLRTHFSSLTLHQSQTIWTSSHGSSPSFSPLPFVGMPA